MANLIQDSNRKSEEIQRLVAKVNDLEKSEADVTSLSKEVAELKEQIGDVEKSLAAARKNVIEEETERTDVEDPRSPTDQASKITN